MFYETLKVYFSMLPIFSNYNIMFLNIFVQLQIRQQLILMQIQINYL